MTLPIFRIHLSGVGTDKGKSPREAGTPSPGLAMFGDIKGGCGHLKCESKNQFRRYRQNGNDSLVMSHYPSVGDDESDVLTRAIDGPLPMPQSAEWFDQVARSVAMSPMPARQYSGSTGNWIRPFRRPCWPAREEPGSWKVRLAIRVGDTRETPECCEDHPAVLASGQGRFFYQYKANVVRHGRTSLPDLLGSDMVCGHVDSRAQRLIDV